MNDLQYYNVDQMQIFIRNMLIVSVFITILQQFPLVKDTLYSEIRIALYLFFGIIVTVSVLNLPKYFRINFIRYFLYTIITSSLLYFIFISFGYSVNLTELLIPFGIIIASISSLFSRQGLKKFIFIYIFLSAILSVSNVLFYVGGFEIIQTYQVPLKNQLGPIIGVSLVILSDWIINYNNRFYKNSKYLIIMFISLFVIQFLSLLVIRNRASILGLILIICLMLIFNNTYRLTYKKIIYYASFLILFIIFLISGTFNDGFAYVWSALTMNYDVTDIDSVSAGRTDVYWESLNYILEQPFIGELSHQSSGITATPHNYLINKVLAYGILGSLPLILFYVYLWVFTVKGLFKNKKNIPVVFWALLFSLIVSQFEYTYPFGPGVSQVMMWFLLGQYLRGNIKNIGVLT